MTRLVECVPNISEGRDLALVARVADEVRGTPGCTLLDVESDASHNRSVITFLGEPEAVLDAAVKLAKRAVELIDLTRHTGEHPRMGAVDVIPFVPLTGCTLDDCAELARRAGARIFAEAGLPVFLYEHAATVPHRRNLADIRRGQFEGMAEKVKQPDWTPDFGGPSIHPTGGVVAVGARAFLVAFNINLSTDKLAVAQAIAKIIRQSSGGLSSVKAIGVMLAERNIAQVSINMTDITKTPLYRVLELVRIEAARYGVSVVGTELIGLTPMRALADSAGYYLMIEGFDRDRQVLENHILERL